jgi:hypothetical protein
MPGTLVKLAPSLTGQLKGLHRTARISRGGCEQCLSSGINQHRPVAHARGRDRQNILRSCADLDHHLMRRITEETPHFESIEVVTKSGGHPMMQWPARAYHRARIHVKKQAADFFAAEVEPH